MGSDVQPLGAMNPSQKIGFQECLLPGAPSLRHNLLLHRHGSVPASGIPRGKKKQAALWQQLGTGTETCAHQLLLLAAPWLCHPPRCLLSLCQQRPAAVTSTVPWHSLSPAPPRTFLCPPHSPGCGQSLLSPSAARISSGVDFSLVVPVCPPALWLLRLSRGRRLARECHISALAPSCPLRVCSASSPLFAACLLPGAAQGQRRATEPSPAAFALPALSCSEISPSRSAVPSHRPAPERAVPWQWCHRCPHSLPPLLVIITQWGQSWARLHGTLKDLCIPKLERKNIRLHGELWSPTTTRPPPRVLMRS